MCDDTDSVKKTMEPCSVKPKWFSCLDKSLNKNDIMPNNKLKERELEAQKPEEKKLEL